MPNDLPLFLLSLSGPAACLAAAAAIRGWAGLATRSAITMAEIAAALSVLAAIALAALTGLNGAATLALADGGPAAPAFRLDAISLPVLVLVTFVGLVVTRFSRNYLAGDPRQKAFFARLLTVLAAAAVLALAGDLIVFAAGWVALSLTLHALLVFYPERPLAVIAARKKFVAARLGDLCILTGFALLWQASGTTSIAAIVEKASAGALGGAGLWAALLIAAAALMKSAQLPFHGWITEVMETPTPVSALLHAGIVNAGGFAVLRFSGLIASEQAALWLLTAVGGATALAASLVMLTQPRIKTQLAWSTIAQMGFMMLQCGFGAFSSALLHIIAHSLYKAHAFLWSGAAAEQRKPAGPQPSPVKPLTTVLAAYAAAAAIFAATGAAVAGALWEKPALAVFGTLLVLGMGQAASGAAGGGGKLILRSAIAMAAVSAVYFALQLAMAALTSGAVATIPAPGTVTIALMALTLLSFAALSVAQALGLHRAPPRWAARLFVHASNGFYANAAFNRAIGALRISTARN